MEDKRDVQISKTLSYLLRHGAVKEKLPIDPQGWIEVEQLLKHHRLKSQQAKWSDIERIVANNAKQRFSLRSDNGSHYICANQGHTLAAITPDLEPISPETMPANVFHGTFLGKLPAIEASGLSRMDRNHIHFTSDAPWSKLGIRGNCSVLIYINTAKLMEDGFNFFRSRNGVILCAGNSDGVIPPQYFARVIKRDSPEWPALASTHK